MSRTIQRLAAVGAVAAVAISLAGCGQEQLPAPPRPDTTQTYPPEIALGGGVTTPADITGPACAQLSQGAPPPQAMATKPVAAAVAGYPMLSELAAALQATGLVDRLNAIPAGTVFAPSNEAFQQLKASMGSAAYTALLQNKRELAAVLNYHVVVKRYDQASLVDLYKGATTLSGGSLTTKETPDFATVTDDSGAEAKVLCGNIPTANATVFVIDKVLNRGQDIPFE